MRFISFVRPDGAASFGKVVNETVVDFGGTNGGSLKQSLLNLDDLSGECPVYPLDEVTLLPVIPDPAKIFCVGLNYAAHVKETGRQKKDYPAIFTRWADTLVAHKTPLQRPTISERFDYEGELAVIIGKPGRAISQERAMEHVAGYSIFNDASVRDWQRHNIQFTPGKNFPGTGAFGPELVTPDEVGDLSLQRVQTHLNGELMQDQPVSDMIWDIPFLIEYCSTFTQLETGDVIVTGTPGGVGDKRNPPVYMKTGDTVCVSIGLIGELVNTVEDA